MNDVFDYYQNGKDEAFNWFTSIYKDSSLITVYRRCVKNLPKEKAKKFHDGFYDELRRINLLSCDEIDNILGGQD